MFGRRKQRARQQDADEYDLGADAERVEDEQVEDEPYDDGEYEDSEYDDEYADDDEGAEADPARRDGPYDVEEIDRRAATGEVALLDLGGLRVPVHDGVELRLDVDQESGQVVSATVVHERSAVQISAFAAPRGEGIWDEVRTDIASGISAAGGTVDRVAGSFGVELHAMVPETGPGGRGALVPARFVGVDGPRWFLRGLFTGAAARDTAAAALLEMVVRGCVVVRGSEPMAPGDVLLLQVPTELPEGLAQGDDDADGPDRRQLPPPRRGPEITEIR